MEYFFGGFKLVLTLNHIGYMFAGVFFGMILGFLPGLNGMIGIALVFPLTFGMPPLTGLVFLLSIYSGSIFGGAVTAILINTPGSAANIATTLDGYPMALQGKAGRAMGIALMSSLLGGVIGCLCLLLLAEPLAYFALKFGPGEMFMVAVFGLTVLCGLSDDLVKSLFSGAVGLMMGTVGMTSLGVVRGTMDSVYLIDGIPLMPAFLGFLAVPEILEQTVCPYPFKKVGSPFEDVREFFGGQREVFRHKFQAVACSIAGVVIGIMPAAGSAVAGLFCYNQSKQFSSKPEAYGTGIPEGIIACETANNSAEGGTLTTMFVLGIPGNGITAIMLGALILQGWMPGPALFFSEKEVIYASISSLFLQQFAMWLVGAVLCLSAAWVIRLPFSYVMPCIVVFMVLGAYSERYLAFDVLLMFFFGGIGILMNKTGFPIAPLILGLILGPLADVQLSRVLEHYDSFGEIFHSPISAALGVCSLVGIGMPVFRAAKKRNAV